MADAPGQDEEMPDAVKIAHLLVEGVKKYTGRIKETACKEPSETGLGQGLEERAERNENEPAHNEVYDHRQNSPPFYGKRLQHDPGNGQPPYGAEDGPAPAPPEGNQRKRGIGAGDEEVDGVVVERSEDIFRLPPQGMVKRRKGIEQK